MARLKARRIYRGRPAAARAVGKMPPIFAVRREPFGVSIRPSAMDPMPVVTSHLFLQFAGAFVLCTAACGLILAGRLRLRRDADSTAWPAVNGVVLDSAIAADRDGGRQRFRPVVRYRYEVDGQRYEGSRIQSAAKEGFRKYTRARRLLDRSRAGSAIKVHYDPSRPGMAVLQPGQAVPALRPIYVVASTAAVYTLFTIGIAIAGN